MVCKKCGIDKDDVEDFYKGRKHCKDCVKQRMRDNYKNDPKPRYKKEYYERNREKVLEYQKIYYGSGKGREYRIKYYNEVQKHRPRMYDKSKRKLYKQEWSRKNKCKVRNYKLKRSGYIKGKFTEDEWNDLLYKYGGKCLRCGTSENITADHVIPLSKGGANTIDNIQPLCRSCNSIKWTKTTDYR